MPSQVFNKDGQVLRETFSPEEWQALGQRADKAKKERRLADEDFSRRRQPPKP